MGELAFRENVMSRYACVLGLLFLVLMASAYGQTTAPGESSAAGGPAPGWLPDAPSMTFAAAADQSVADSDVFPSFNEAVSSGILSPAARAPRPRRTVDGQFLTWLVVSNVATVLDIESTIHALNTSPDVYETNSWFYGSHPNRARLYGTSIPLNVGVSYVAYLTKKRVCPSARCWLWHLPLAALSAAHGAAGVANYARF